MSDTNFTDKVTAVVSSWLQDINDVVYRLLGSSAGTGGAAPTTRAEIVSNLGIATSADLAAFEASLAGSTGSSLVGFLQSGTGAVATDLQTLLRFLFKTPQAFGAIADGTSHPLSERYATLAAAQADYPHAVALTDEIDWAAFQALIRDQFAGVGGYGYVPDGHYMLNRPLSLDNAQGWSLISQSWYGHVLEQTSDNTPIFNFTGASTHYYSFLLNGFYGKWTNNQTSADTSSVMIQFNPNSAAIINYDSFRINRIHCENGYRMISTNPTGAYALNVWGYEIDGLNHGSNCSGAAVWIESPIATGMPNGKFGSVYINCAQSHEANFYLKDCGMFNIENLEFNSLTKTGLHLNHCTQWNIHCIRHESCTITDTSLTLIENGGGTIHQYHAESCTLPNGAAFIGGGTASSYAPLIVHTFGEGNTSITGGTGTLYVADGVGAYPIVFTTWPVLKSSNILRWNMSTGAGVIDYVKVLEALSPFHSYGNLTDADHTLEPYTDAICQTVPTLTANRSITLDKVDAFNGLSFIIQRISASPGAFTLTIKNSAGGTILTMPASEKHVAEFIWSRQNDWTVRSYTPAL